MEMSYWCFNKDWHKAAGYGDTFKAVRVKAPNGNIELLPVKPDEHLDGKIFVLDYGWMSEKKKQVEIPYYDNKSENWLPYLHKYGMNCLFYSLSGEALESCDMNRRYWLMEFKAIYMTGPKDYAKIMQMFLRLHELQRKGLEKAWNIEKALLYFMPDFIKSIPELDEKKDNEKMELAYINIWGQKLTTEHELYKECEEARAEYDKAYAKHSRDKARVQSAKDKWREKRLKIKQDVNRTLQLDLRTGMFPIYTLDRVEFLFGKECRDLYDKILNHRYE